MISERQRVVLYDMVATVESKFPVVKYVNGDSRAEEAAKLLEANEIMYVGESYGIDYYRCHGHTASVKGGGCTCSDEGAFVDGRKFCKHRLAAMFLVKLNGHPEARLAKLLANAPSDELTLRVYVLHTIDGDKYRMDGHRYGGGTWVRYERDDCWDFTFQQFERVTREAGWGLASRPIKQPSMYFHYQLARGIGEYGLSSVHIEARERHLQEQQFNEIRAIEDGNDAFRALPVELQNAIKEKLYAN